MQSRARGRQSCGKGQRRGGEQKPPLHFPPPAPIGTGSSTGHSAALQLLCPAPWVGTGPAGEAAPRRDPRGRSRIAGAAFPLTAAASPAPPCPAPPVPGSPGPVRSPRPVPWFALSMALPRARPAAAAAPGDALSARRPPVPGRVAGTARHGRVATVTVTRVSLPRHRTRP